MSDKVTIYTDGSCLDNPGGKGGWAALFEGFGKVKVLYGSAKSTTNNRMELISAVKALNHLRRPSEVYINSDSKYVIDGATKWLRNWQERYWTNSQGKPVKNKELWVDLVIQMAVHDTHWRWVRGHSGVLENEVADYYATKAAHEQSEETLLDLTGVTLEKILAREESA